ncbi:ATP-binding protein [Aequorivita sediminis]|uniref:ATP-binding protein n=1 Tax=Aequorivita sediminis TaxID=3073653 RepID=UPI0028AFDC6D|nr:ATP-binding protein [Aequorivita sp. F6058]
MENSNNISKQSDSIRLKAALDLYENAPCGSVIFRNDGIIVTINETLANWLGYRKSEIINLRTLPSLFKVGGQIYFETHFFPLIKMQGFIQEVYFDIVRKDKSIFHALVNVREIPSDGSNEATYQATILNVSDRRKYEKELLDAKRKAEAESKAKAEFLATISHEIRTPLNAILGIGNLLHDTPLNENQKEYARLLLGSSEHLLSLVNNLLDLSKIEAKKLALEYVSFNIYDLITTLKEIYSVKAAEKNVELRLELTEDVPLNIIGDPVKLNQILTNLIGNAIKFTKEGSITVVISVLKKIKKQVTLKFEVADTGIGIPEEKLEAIFQEFSQASYDVSVEYGGTGLGLTISKKLLELQGSQLHVNSKLHEGSTFSFELNYKIDKKKSKKSEKAPDIQEDINFDDYKVLIVDDNDVNIFITAQYLDQWHIPYITAKSGSKALSILNNESVDIILLDLQMPKMDGYQTAEKIRALKLPKKPVIVAYSATTKGEVQPKLIEVGIDDHLSKPFQPAQLFDLLKTYKTLTQTKGKKRRKKLLKTAIQSKKYAKQLKPEVAETSHESFSLERYQKMANNKPEYLQKFVRSSFKAVQDYNKEFKKAVKSDDATQLDKLIHQSTMTLYYLKADTLTALMKKCSELITTNNAASELAAATKECKKEFKTIVEGLKRNLK